MAKPNKSPHYFVMVGGQAVLTSKIKKLPPGVAQYPLAFEQKLLGGRKEPKLISERALSLINED
jgi:hypothetical protein